MPVGQRAEVEVTFLTAAGNGCIANCTFEVVPAGIARCLTPMATSATATLVIEGLAPGEASLKVMCNGALLGYFHIWCERMVTIDVDVVSVETTRSSPTSVDIGALKAVLDKIYRQALIQWDVVDIGSVDLSGDAEFEKKEKSLYTGQTYNAYPDEFSVIGTAVTSALANRWSIFVDPPRPEAIRVHYYRPASVRRPPDGTLVGSVSNFGQRDVWIFVDSAGLTENVIAHEIGHIFVLVHPDEPFLGNIRRMEYPQHHLDSLGLPIPPIAATNTEPAVGPATALPNVMAADPMNLMGYWIDPAQTEMLRYRQWKNMIRQ